MKTMDLKALMLLTFLIASLLSLPAMVFAQDGEGDDVEKTEEYGAFENYHGGFGGIFRDNMGYGGQIIGSLFEMLLLDGLDLENHEELEDVYVLSASKEETYEGNYSFAENQDTMQIHYLPFYNSTGGNVSQYRTEPIGAGPDPILGYAYCIVEKEGGFGYNLTVGAALTLIIWDNDKSFITAAQKVLDWAGRYREAEEDDKVTSEIIAEGVQVLSWLLVHINEIFTGDELFVFNPIVWQTLDMEPWANFNIEKTWYDTGVDLEMDKDDIDLTGLPILTEWSFAANITRDSYMQWLLQDFDTSTIAETLWTQFSFDLAQLWMKKFYVEIDLEELSKGEDAKVKKAFEGCEVEFYLFTHHLAGAFLYYDSDNSGDVTVNYDYARNETTGEILYVNETAVMIPQTNEVTHRLILANVEDFDFSEPEIDEEDKKVKWGLQLNDVNMSAVPVSVDLNSYMSTEPENLDYIFFGLEFDLDVDLPDAKGQIEAQGDVKLETDWAPWNDKDNPYTKTNITDLDMAIVYVSSVLHFELDMERDDDPDDPEDENQDYDRQEHTLEVGNYIDEDEDDLEFVDIAGKGYFLGNETDRDPFTANTSEIHLALWQGSSQMRETDPGDDDDTSDDISTDVNVEAEWKVQLYAVCYPDFNGSGMGIWHDPTFSVYMVFTPESAGFWALILLIAGVGLAGVAAILIKKKKEGW